MSQLGPVWDRSQRVPTASVDSGRPRVAMSVSPAATSTPMGAARVGPVRGLYAVSCAHGLVRMGFVRTRAHSAVSSSSESTITSVVAAVGLVGLEVVASFVGPVRARRAVATAVRSASSEEDSSSVVAAGGSRASVRRPRRWS